MITSPLLVRPRIPAYPEIESFINFVRDENGYPDKKYILKLAGIRTNESPRLILMDQASILPHLARLLYVSIPDLYHATLHRFAPLFFRDRFLSAYKGLPCFNLHNREQWNLCFSNFHLQGRSLRCPYCYQENGYDFIFWHVKLIPACPMHGCFLESFSSDPTHQPQLIDNQDRAPVNLFLFFLGAGFAEISLSDLFGSISWLRDLPPNQFFEWVKWMMHFSFNFPADKWVIGSDDQVETLGYLRHIYQILKTWPDSVNDLLEKYVEGQSLPHASREQSMPFMALGEDYRSILRQGGDYPQTAAILLDVLRRFIEEHYLFYLRNTGSSQNGLIGASIFLGFSQDTLLPILTKMNPDGGNPIGKGLSEGIVDWNLVDYIMAHWPKNAWLIREYAARYSLDGNTVQRLIAGGGLSIDDSLIDLGIPQPLVFYHPMNLLGTCWSEYYFSVSDRIPAPPLKTDRMISLSMAVATMGFDLCRLLQSMVSGCVRYTRIQQPGGAEAYYLYLADLQSQSYPFRVMPQTDEVIEICTIGELVHWDQSYPGLIENWMKGGQIKIFGVNPSSGGNDLDDRILRSDLITDVFALSDAKRFLLIKEGTTLHHRIESDNDHWKKSFIHYDSYWGDQFFDPIRFSLSFKKQYMEFDIHQLLFIVYRWGIISSRINKYERSMNKLKKDMVNNDLQPLGPEEGTRWSPYKVITELSFLQVFQMGSNFQTSDG